MCGGACAPAPPPSPSLPPPLPPQDGAARYAFTILCCCPPAARDCPLVARDCPLVAQDSSSPPLCGLPPCGPRRPMVAWNRPHVAQDAPVWLAAAPLGRPVARGRCAARPMRRACRLGHASTGLFAQARTRPGWHKTSLRPCWLKIASALGGSRLHRPWVAQDRFGPGWLTTSLRPWVAQDLAAALGGPSSR